MSEAQQLTKKLVEMNNEAAQLRNTISLLEGQLQKRSQADSELAKARVEINKLNESVKEKDVVVVTKTKELVDIGAKHAEQLTALQQRLTESETARKADVSALTAKLVESETAAKSREAALEAKNHTLMQQLADNEKRLQELDGELKQLRADVQTKTAKEQIQGLTNEVRGVVQKTTELEAETKATREQNEKLIKKIDKLKVQLKAYQEEKIAAGRSGVPPPVGKVTLVFTDVQGSTAQWEAMPDAMAIALKLHNHLMRSSMEAYGGYEVKTEGDAFMIAFSSPVKAVKWCMETQQKLLELSWPEKTLQHPDGAVVAGQDGATLFRGLRVRMGAHTGEPDCQQDPVTGRMDYFGPMVNRSARVEGFTHGGQIVISSDVWDAIEPKKAELGEIVVKDLGNHRFKGLTTDTHVYQIMPRQLSARTFAKDNNNVMLGLPHEMQELHGKATTNKEHLLELSKKLVEVRQTAKNLVAKLRTASGPDALQEAMAEVEKVTSESTVIQHSLVQALSDSKEVMKNLYNLEEKYNDQHALEDINVCCTNMLILLKNMAALMKEAAFQDDGSPKSRILDIDALIREAANRLKSLYQNYIVERKG